MLTTKKKYRFIIIEGPDCSGKSSLVERLKNTLRWDSKYLRHAKNNQFFRYLIEYATQKDIIFDRAHYSENVYSTLWRGGSPFKRGEKEVLDAICDMHALTIFCIPSRVDMRERYQKRGFEQQITLEEMETSYSLFQKEAAKVGHIVYHSKNYQELETFIARVKELVL